MAAVVHNLVLFFLFLLNLAGVSNSSCPSSFNYTCHSTRKFRPECGGLFLLQNRSSSEKPYIQFEARVTNCTIQENNKFFHLNPLLSEANKKDLCFVLFRNLSPSFHVTPDHTLFECFPPLHSGPRSHKNCSWFDVQECVSDDQIPPKCLVVQVPLNMAKKSMEYERQCHNSGGQRNVILIASTVSGGGLLLIIGSILTYIFWKRKKRINQDYLLSRSISFGPSSKLDLEGGSSYFGIPVFSYTELEKATNNFDTSKELGDGGFGTVYYGKLGDGREVAIKRLYEHNYRRVQQFMNEIKILTGLRHKNLVSLYGCTSRRSRELLLVYEYVSNGTVSQHLQGERAGLSWPVRLSIAIETADALAYLHKSDIIHRDVKTCNILLDDNFCVKVADFGLSRLFPNNVTHVSTAPQGTPGYVDPDYHLCYQLTDKSDVYSFGVVLIELISSMPAVDITRHRHEINLANLAVNMIQRCAFDELIDKSLGYDRDAEVARMTTQVAELAFRCLQADKDMRPSMDEVVEFLKDVRGGEKEGYDGSKCGKVMASPEADDVVLLKINKSVMASPNAVIGSWVSSSSTGTSSVG